ncbi:MAG: DUF2157 domain-containing protein [Verrucomicrobiota bacterium]
MNSNRAQILNWFEEHLIPKNKLRSALNIAAVLPTSTTWQYFLDRLLLFMGVGALATGIIFFFAFNWQDLDRFAKFALAEAPILVALIFVWRVGVDTIVGKATLLFASLLAGALLALIGQTYQTGADTFELFIAWAAVILPWTLIARFPTLWLLWLLLLNIASSLYFTTLARGASTVSQKPVWVAFAINTTALLVWELLAATRLRWLNERWAVRLIATASGGLATILCLGDIFDWSKHSHLGAPSAILWILLVLRLYRRLIRDIYILAIAIFSSITIVTAWIGQMSNIGDSGIFLLLGQFVICMSAAGGAWLKQVANEKNL